MLRIGIISDSPTLTTGFSTTAKQIAKALVDAGHYVVSFGLNAFGETFDRNRYPFKIWAAGGRDELTFLSEFFRYEKLDVLIINVDIITLQKLVMFCAALGWQGPTIAYFVLDGLPLHKEHLAALSSIHTKITATRVGAAYLASQGIEDVCVVPHGVDSTIFYPMNKTELKEKAGLKEKFVVGVFGRNTERKQQVRVLQALAHLKNHSDLSDICVYFHCVPRGYWNLKAIAEDLEVDDITCFLPENFDETVGIPNSQAEKENRATQIADQKIDFFAGYTYPQRMNCCDMILNVSHCGGFELAIIEAQACGVPVAVTNDESIMVEVIGNGGRLLACSDVSFWRHGQNTYFVSIPELANTILELKNNTELRKRLSLRGMENARLYRWELLRDCIVNAVSQFKHSD